MVAYTRLTALAGKPPSRACSWMLASSGAMYSQYTLSAVTWLRTHCTCGPSSRSTPQDFCEMARSSSGDNLPAPGISRSMI